MQKKNFAKESYYAISVKRKVNANDVLYKYLSKELVISKCKRTKYMYLYLTSIIIQKTQEFALQNQHFADETRIKYVDVIIFLARLLT